MEIGKKRFCPRVFFRCRTKLAKLGDLSTDAVFGSYRDQFPDKNEAENPIFVRALDKNVFVPILSCFGPPNYPLSHGTISFSAKVSPLTTSSPYFFQSALRISSTPLLIFFPNNLLEIALTSVMVGGRLRDLISSARRRTSSSVGFRHYSQGARAILLLFSVNPRHEQTIAQNTFAHSPIVAVSTVAIPITPINRHPNATPAA